MSAGSSTILSDHINSFVASTLTSELNGNALRSFDVTIHADYSEAMCNTIGFNEASTYLISKGKISQYYERFRNVFPYCHYVFSATISTNHYSIPSDIIGTGHSNNTSTDNTNEMELHIKKRKLLFIFFALLQTRSNSILSNLAQVGPLGTWSKGFQQPGSKSLSGAFSSDLRTCWNDQDICYERLVPSFNKELKGEVTITAAFDNY